MIFATVASGPCHYRSDHAVILIACLASATMDLTGY